VDLALDQLIHNALLVLELIIYNLHQQLVVRVAPLDILQTVEHSYAKLHNIVILHVVVVQLKLIKANALLVHQHFHLL
jgi:hypothetical protein